MGEEEESYESETRTADDEEEEETSSDSPPSSPELICSRFEVREMIGSGSYSEVFAGFDRVVGDEVAVKLEWVHAEKGRKLLAEAQLYGSLAGCGRVPGMRWHGVEGEYNAMVMELLGPSLEELFSSCGRRFSLRTVLLLAQQMLDCIEGVHARGIVHRDIKPHNFLTGLGPGSDRVYIMDFGLAKRFRDPETYEHIPCATGRKGVTGTVRYASLNVHDGLEPSRRDDLEGIGHVLLHFLRGSLPWQGLRAASKRAKHRKIGQCKRDTPIEELCRGFPGEFTSFMRHCRALDFADRPDYEYLRGLMRHALERECSGEELVLDWLARAEGPGPGQRGGEAQREPRSGDRRRVSADDEAASQGRKRQKRPSPLPERRRRVWT